MANLVHTTDSISVADLTALIDPTVATSGTTTHADCTKTGLVISEQSDQRATVTDTVNFPVGTGSVDITVLADHESSI